MIKMPFWERVDVASVLGHHDHPPSRKAAFSC